MAHRNKEDWRKYIRGYNKRRRKNDPTFKAKWDARCKRIRETRRRRAIDMIGGPKCVGCGCDRYAILEINHKNGHGRVVSPRGKVISQILNGKIPVSDFNVMCRVCNALHYVCEILGIRGHTVIWNPT